MEFMNSTKYSALFLGSKYIAVYTLGKIKCRLNTGQYKLMCTKW